MFAINLLQRESIKRDLKCGSQTSSVKKRKKKKSGWCFIYLVYWLSQVFSNANQEKLFHPSTGYMKWEQQAKQVIPDVLLSRNAFQFLLRDPNVFLRQIYNL